MDYKIGSDIFLLENDITANEFGDIMLISDNQNIVQTAINNIKTIFGELENDDQRGNMAYSRRIKLNDTGMISVSNDCANAILQDNRIKVISVDAVRSTLLENTCEIWFKISRIDNNEIISSNIAINLSEV